MDVAVEVHVVVVCMMNVLLSNISLFVFFSH